MFAAQKNLVLAFFSYNAVNLVVSFHVFVDVCATVASILSTKRHVYVYEPSRVNS